MNSPPILEPILGNESDVHWGYGLWILKSPWPYGDWCLDLGPGVQVIARARALLSMGIYVLPRAAPSRFPFKVPTQNKKEPQLTWRRTPTSSVLPEGPAIAGPALAHVAAAAAADAAGMQQICRPKKGHQSGSQTSFFSSTSSEGPLDWWLGLVWEFEPLVLGFLRVFFCLRVPFFAGRGKLNLSCLEPFL